MTTTLRLYAGDADNKRMAALARAFPREQIHLIDLPYRLSSWAFDHPRNVGLWEDSAGRLLGWAVLQAPFWALDYAFQPAMPDLHARILSWASTRSREIMDEPGGRPIWFANVRDDQTERLADLERAGYPRQDAVPVDPWSKVWMRRSGRQPVAAAPLPTGFQLRPLAGAAEVAAYVALHRHAFESDSMTAAWRARTLQRPEYRPDLDLVIEAPDGRLAAFCVTWYTDHGFDDRPAGQVEPLGVHTEFRGLGLGRAVLHEAMRRLQACGAENLYVETDNYRDAAYALYQSAGFEVLHTIWVCRREVRPI